MSPENFLKAQLAEYAYAEAFEQGGVNGMLAVACILRNRVRAGWFGGDWSLVLNAADDAAPFEPEGRPKIEMSNGNFRALLQEVDDIFLGMYRDDLTGRDERDPRRKHGGLYYCNIVNDRRELRPWFDYKILKDRTNHPQIAQVGMLYIFS